jgi:hypothetical protein
MIKPARCESKRGLKIFGFEIRHLLEDLLRGQASREQIENIAHADTHPTDTWPPPTLLGIDRDSLAQGVHGVSITIALAQLASAT